MKKLRVINLIVILVICGCFSKSKEQILYDEAFTKFEDAVKERPFNPKAYNYAEFIAINSPDSKEGIVCKKWIEGYKRNELEEKDAENADEIRNENKAKTRYRLAKGILTLDEKIACKLKQIDFLITRKLDNADSLKTLALSLLDSVYSTIPYDKEGCPGITNKRCGIYLYYSKKEYENSGPGNWVAMASKVMDKEPEFMISDYNLKIQLNHK